LSEIERKMERKKKGHLEEALRCKWTNEKRRHRNKQNIIEKGQNQNGCEKEKMCKCLTIRL
jgi:hypothetical protein